MSKIKNKIYAIALAESILNAKREKDKKIAANFLKLLKDNSDIKKAEEIILLAEDIIARKNGNKKIVAETARKINVKPIIKSFAKTDDKVLEKINPELIAGVKIIINGERQLDFSLSRKLENVLRHDANLRI